MNSHVMWGGKSVGPVVGAGVLALEISLQLKNGATKFHLENLVGSVTAVQVSQIFKLISWLSSHHVDGPGPLTI